MPKHELLDLKVEPKDDTALLEKLTPVFGELYQKHVKVPAAIGDWTPAKFVPYGVGETYDEKYIWKPEDLPLPAAVRASLTVGEATEENLPHYAIVLTRGFEGNEAMRKWTNLWVYEESRHGRVLGSFLDVTRLLDPVMVEMDRKAQLTGGNVPEPDTAAEAIVYVSLQEAATRLAHRNSAVATEEHVLNSIELQPKLSAGERERRQIIAKAGLDIMTRISMDESRHFAFYNGTVKAGLKFDPSSMMIAIYRQVAGFKMPGQGIPHMDVYTDLIAKSGIYSPANHYSQIVQPIVETGWKVDQVDGLNEKGKRAQEALMKELGRLSRVAKWWENRYEVPDFGPVPLPA